MNLPAIRTIVFAFLLNLAAFMPALANQDHFEDVQKANMYTSDDQRMQYIGQCFRAEPSQHRRTPPLKFCSEAGSYDCFFISRTEQFHVIDYVKPTDFKIQFDWGKIAYIDTNEFEWGYRSRGPDRAIFDCPKPKKAVVKKKPRKIKRKCCRCCCHCNPCWPCNRCAPKCNPCYKCRPCADPCNDPCRSGKQKAPPVNPAAPAPPGAPAGPPGK